MPSRSAGSRPSPTLYGGPPGGTRNEITWAARVAGDQLGAVEGVGADPGEGRAAANSRVLM